MLTNYKKFGIIIAVSEIPDVTYDKSRGVAQLVARDVWEQDTGGDAPAGKRALRAKKQNLESPCKH